MHYNILVLSSLGVLRYVLNRDFKQNTTEGATTATVTKEDWREYVPDVLSPVVSARATVKCEVVCKMVSTA